VAKAADPEARVEGARRVQPRQRRCRCRGASATTWCQPIDFVNAINLGHEPRDRVHGMYYLRDGDEDKPAPGLPDLPPAYKALIRATDTSYTVSTVERQPDRSTPRATSCS
jgi:hypothetical protein